MAAGSVALLVLRRRRGVLLVAGVLVGAWLLTGEVYATTGNTNYAKVFAPDDPGAARLGRPGGARQAT